MQRRLAKLFAAGSAFGVVALLFWSHPAGADVVTPPGACVGTGVWQGSGLNESTTKHVPGDVITIPQSYTVAWTGLQRGFSPGQQGPRRDISGHVKLGLPFGDVTIDSWKGSSTKYANAGTKHYNIPSVIKGVKMKLSGEHSENGAVTCSGSVYVKVEGSGLSSPLGIASIVGIVVMGFLLFLAGRPVF